MEKYNLNLVTKFITKKGFKIKYGNINFLYFTYSDKYYEKCNKAFFRKELSKETYQAKMVKITMKVMDKFCNKVNIYLKIKNSTSYLKMIYKKVLFPMYFISKKKYFKIEHKKIINFKSKNFSLKGLIL